MTLSRPFIRFSSAFLLAGALTATAAEPIPIRQSDIPVRIDSPGVYLLVEDILSGTTAITITADDVTIDLGGHTITGPGRWADQPAFAIAAPADSHVQRIVVMNGTIAGFPTSAVSLPGSQHAAIRNLSIHDIGEVAIDVGDEATINGNHIESLGIRDPTRTGAVIGIRAGLNSIVEENTIARLHHGGNGHLDAIRVGRGCYVVANRIEDLTSLDSGTGDVTGIACATMAADIRANHVTNIANSRPGGIGIGIRLGSGSAERNKVSNVSSASLAIGIQGIAAVFIERNDVDGVRAINNGPDAYGIWAAGTGGRVIGNTIQGVDCGGDERRNREIGLRANSAFEISSNSIHLPKVRDNAHQAGIEISGSHNVIVQNTIRLGGPTDQPGIAVFLGAVTRANTVVGNETNGHLSDHGNGNTVPASGANAPAI